MKKLTAIFLIVLIVAGVAFATISDSDYRNLTRRPDSVTQEYWNIDGEVIQWFDASDEGYDMYRINTKMESWGYSGNTVLVVIFDTYNFPKLMEGDIVHLTGLLYRGPYTYNSALAANITIPWFQNVEDSGGWFE